MSNKIKFLAQSEHVWEVRERPFPAAKKIPQWWKDIPVYGNDADKLILDPAPNVTVKKCIPTVDMFSTGYYMPLWSDCLIKQEDGFPTINWNVSEPVFDTWPQVQVSSFNFGKEYSNVAFKYLHGWTIKTPPGWSCLFTHPVAYPDLPFKSISGIVDTDVLNTGINVPVVIKKGFEGTIEQGTPMFQIIPFKRSHWDSEFELKKQNQDYFDLEKLRSKIIRAYGHLIKDKKIYR
jgi:hypothetical protein